MKETVTVKPIRKFLLNKYTIKNFLLFFFPLFCMLTMAVSFFIDPEAPNIVGFLFLLVSGIILVFAIYFHYRQFGKLMCYEYLIDHDGIRILFKNKIKENIGLTDIKKVLIVKENKVCSSLIIFTDDSYKDKKWVSFYIQNLHYGNYHNKKILYYLDNSKIEAISSFLNFDRHQFNFWSDLLNTQS